MYICATSKSNTKIEKKNNSRNMQKYVENFF